MFFIEKKCNSRNKNDIFLLIFVRHRTFFIFYLYLEKPCGRY